jgi:hypothetical protein
MEERKSDTIKAPQCKYRPEYCQKLIDHMTKGLSVSTFGKSIGVSRATVYEWISTIPEFKEAHELAIQHAQEFFEVRLSAKIAGQDIKGIDTKKIDTTALIFALKTRFHETYGDKAQLVGSGEIKIVIDKDDEGL